MKCAMAVFEKRVILGIFYPNANGMALWVDMYFKEPQVRRFC